MFQMHRVFCATPWELEGERRRFHDLIGRFNEERAMPLGILFIPVSLVNIRDKRPMQYVVDENIQDSSAYLLSLSDGWGPVEMNFENDFLLASQCLADSTLPMRRVTLLRKAPLSRHPDVETAAHAAEFATMEEFERCAAGELAKLLESLTNVPDKARLHATA